MNLLDLPPELFTRIIDVAMLVNGLDEAMHLRLVSKLFDHHVIYSLCHRRVYDVLSVVPHTNNVRLLAHLGGCQHYPYARRLMREQLYVDCLHGNRADRRSASSLINDVVDIVLNRHISHLTTSEAQKITRAARWHMRNDFVRHACSIYKSSHGDNHVARCNCAHYYTNPRLDASNRLQHALVLAASLGLMPVVRSLLDADGIAQEHTLFGCCLSVLALQTSPAHHEILDLVISRLQAGAPAPHARSLDARHSVYAAAAANNLTALKKMLRGPWYDDVRTRLFVFGEEYTEEMIAHAAAGGSVELVEMVLEWVVELKGFVEEAKLYMWCLDEGSRSSIERLLDVVVASASSTGNVAVLEAALTGGLVLSNSRVCGKVNVGSQRGIDPNMPLMLAARWGSLEAVRTLLRHGALVERNIYPTFYQPLMRAVQNGFVSVAQELIKAGASIGRGDRFCGVFGDSNHIRVATHRRHIDMVGMLLDLMETWNQDPSLHAELFDWSTRNGQVSITKQLLARGVRLSNEYVLDTSGLTAIGDITIGLVDSCQQITLDEIVKVQGQTGSGLG